MAISIRIRTPETELEWANYYDLRYRILREPLNQLRGSEKNEGDLTGIHFALYKYQQLIGIARLDHMNELIYQVRFVAIDSPFQGKSYGKLIMKAVEEKVLQLNGDKIILHARENAVEFYKSLAYSMIEPSHLLFGQIQHYLMEKKIR
jgi:GNAT superfamily N-acetyltransferase